MSNRNYELNERLDAIESALNSIVSEIHRLDLTVEELQWRLRNLDDS